MWTAILANTLLSSNERWGSTWAWRIVRFVHALPFLAGAFVFGCVNGYAWGVTEVPLWFHGALCSGIVAVGMTVSWVKEWRRSRRND
jgi:hypothetical protein